MAITDFDKVELLLPFNEANLATTFADFSARNRSVLVYGDAKISTANGYSALYLDGTIDHLEVPGFEFSGVNSLTAKGMVDTVVDLRVYRGSLGVTQYLICSGNPGSGTGALQAYRQGMLIFIGTDNKVAVEGGNLSRDGSANFAYVKSSGTVPTGESHIRICINSNAIYIAINGVFQTVSAVSPYQSGLTNCAIYHVENLNIGSSGYQLGATGSGGGSPSVAAACYIRDLVITRATGGTTDFTPPAGGSLIKTISGNVKGDTDANAARLVRAYPRAWPTRGFETISDGTSGNYSLPVPDVASGLDVVFQDDDAGTQYKDKILSHMTPV
jgi:hypothetical protein